ncbi:MULTISPECIES: copper resistance CopC family protein [Micrococcaceae]|uniref:copper resistance CopC family protein n=1 Tax=Micrococcaceae TaxID=1268 RepID=UPI001A7E1965|nr:copper resistance CopC family protein [Glutamicibacter sp. BW78]MDN5755570.1 copper resistance protein CopC [Micrococcaceae bacterium]MDN5880505.1 copper resistance protein CopC [Micrococcaceae bacterium]
MALALLAAALFFGTAPASAHDDLISSNPATGQVIQTAPEEADLQYSGQIMDMGALVRVVDSDGTDWATGKTTIKGRGIDVSLKPGMPDGQYEIRWRVVSEDGHPISGLIPFAVGNVAAPTAPLGSGRKSIGEEPAAATSDQVSPAMARGLLIAGIGVAAAGITFIALLFFKRANPTKR